MRFSDLQRHCPYGSVTYCLNPSALGEEKFKNRKNEKKLLHNVKADVRIVRTHNSLNLK